MKLNRVWITFITRAAVGCRFGMLPKGYKNVTTSNRLILNRLFTHSVFQDLIKYEKSHVYSAVVGKYVENHQNKKHIDIFKEIYTLLSQKYRNEYFYKNTLLTKLLLHRHNINKTIALTQIPIGKSKADFVLINGKATVYEIKSELDNFSRLKSQLEDYFKAFGRVCVVGPEGEFDKLYDMLSNTPVGIYCLTKRDTFSKTKRKEPISHYSELEYRSIFRVLYKYEYEYIVKSYFGGIPNTTQVQHYDAYLEMFSSIPILEAYQRSLAVIKNRTRRINADVKQFPYFLNSVLYFLNPSSEEVERLCSFLNKQFGECD